MKVFVHIGDARTGSSTLQAALMHNRSRLRDAGIDYPILGTREGKGIAHHKLSFSLLPAWPTHSVIEPVAADVIWPDLLEYMDGLDAHTIILSSEAFLNLPSEGIAYLKSALGSHDVTPICVWRDPEDWRKSWLAHRILQGHVVPPPKEPARDLAGPKLARWKEHFDVVTVTYSETVLADVLAAMGLEIGSLELLDRRNERCPDDVLQLLNALNAIELCEANRTALQDVVRDMRAGSQDVLIDLPLDTIDRVTFNQTILNRL